MPGWFGAVWSGAELEADADAVVNWRGAAKDAGNKEVGSQMLSGP